jgi:hypothetical protein
MICPRFEFYDRAAIDMTNSQNAKCYPGANNKEIKGQYNANSSSMGIAG